MNKTKQKYKLKIGKWTRLQPQHNKNRNVFIFLLKFTSQTVGYFLILNKSTTDES